MTGIDYVLWLGAYILVAGLIPGILILYLRGPAARRIRERDQILEDVGKAKFDDAKTQRLVDKFKDSTQKAIADRYAPRNYLLPLSFISLVLFIGFFLIFNAGEPLARFRPTLDGVLMSIPTPAYYGFIGGCLFSLFAIISRYYSADITPTLLLHLACQILLSGGMGYFASTLWPGDSWDASVAFALGFIPYTEITDVLRSKAREKLGIATNAPMDEDAKRRLRSDDLNAIDGIPPKDRERLKEEDIGTVQNLAFTNPLYLYIVTPYSMQRIIDWIDQACLLLYIPADALVDLGKMGVRGVIELSQCGDVENPDDKDQIVAAGNRIKALAHILNDDDVSRAEYLVYQIKNDPQVRFLTSMWRQFSGT